MSERRDAVVMVLLVVAVALSGCLADDETPAGPGDDPDGSGSGPSGDTGDIRVLVSSDQFMPLEEARVQLLTMDRETTGHEVTTDESGETVLSGVDPGEYIVYATAIGFKASHQVVEVTQGKQVETHVTLTPLPRVGPYQEEFDRAGHVTWAAAWQVEPPVVGCIIIENPAGVLDPKSCGGVRGGGGEAGETHVGPGASAPDGKKTDLEDMKTLIVEMRWDPAGPLGEEFLLDLMCSDVPRGAGGAVLDTDHDCYIETQGSSPLRIRLDAEHWEEHGYNFTGTWAARVFATYGMLGTHGLTGIDMGLAYEQSFEIYWTIFHGEPAPEGFSRLPDG